MIVLSILSILMISKLARYCPKELQKIILSGVPRKTLAFRLGVSDATLYGYLKKSGLNPSVRWERAYARDFREMHDMGFSYPEIGEAYGLSAHVVVQWLKRWGLYKRSRKRVRPISPPEAKELQKRLAEGESFRSLERKHNYYPGQIRKHLKKMGLEYRATILRNGVSFVK